MFNAHSSSEFPYCDGNLIGTKFAHTVLSLINAPGALQFFKRGMFIRGKFSMQKCSV